MKKKFMMVAVLLGALTLGACVDDNESQSVTDVRTAKAEQLRAMADLYKAQAEAELIYANAEKAYKEAQAEYEKARAAAEQAAADQIQFELQKAKEAYERNLEAINLEAQNRLLQAKIDAAEKEKEFLALASEQLKELYRQYAAEVNTLDVLKSDLNYQNNLIAQYETQSISIEKANAAQKAIYEKEILGYQKQIEAYKAYEGKDKSELQEEVGKLYTIWSNENYNYTQARIVANNAYTAYAEALESVTPFAENVTLKTLQAVYTIYQLGYYQVITTEDFIINEEFGLSTTKFALTNSEYSMLSAKNELADREAEIKEYLGTPATEKEAATGYYANLKTWEDRLAELQKAETPDEEEIRTAKEQIAMWTDMIANAKEQLAEATQNIKDFDTAVAAFAGDDWKAYEAALEGLKSNESVVAYINALIAEDDAWERVDQAVAEYNAAYELANNSVNAQEMILEYEQLIAQNELYISQLTNNYDVLLQQAKDNVARLTTQIELQEAVVAIAKKNLDDAIAAQE